MIGYFVASGRTRHTWLHIVVPIAGAVVTIWVLVEASRTAQLVGLAWLAAGVLVFSAMKRSPRTA